MAGLSVQILALCAVFFCFTSCSLSQPENFCTEVGRSCNTNSDCCSSCCTEGLCLRSCDPTDNPCNRVRCMGGTQCVLEQVTCIKAPCDPAAICKEVNPCATVRCSAGSKCIAKQVYCIRAPCPPVPKCVKDVEATNPCALMLCQQGTQCVLQPGSCCKPPCPPVPECVPIASARGGEDGGHHGCK